MRRPGTTGFLVRAGATFATFSIDVLHFFFCLSIDDGDGCLVLAF